MNRYESYKETGVQWIGEIPRHWGISRLKFLSNKLRSGGTPKADNSNFYTDESGTPWVAIADMSTVDFVKETEKHLTEAGLKDKNLQIYPAGTLLYSIYATLGKVAELSIPAAINQAILAISLKKKYLQSFCKYVLKAQEKFVIGLASTNTQANLNAEKVSNYYMPVPPLEEQKAIADFLNAKTSELDAEKQNLQKQIEVLSELRQVIITNIVTKGIDNAVKTKDSGQDWIGNIPLHWKAKRFKYIGKCHNGLTYSPNDVCDENEGVLVLRSSNIQNSKLSFEDNVYVKTVPSKLMVKKGDVIICSRNGSISLVGKSAYVDEDINATYGAFMLRFRTNEDSKFMYYLLQQAIKFYKGLCFTTTVNQLTNEIFDNMWGVVPPIDEQKAIADYLDKKTAEIDEQIQLQEQQIKLIDELKQSIISQAVTGKIKVF